MRLRLLALFAAYGMATLGVAGAALWLAARGGTDAVVQGVMVAGFGLAGLATGLWYLFDQHLARPIEMLAGSLRTGRPPDLSKTAHLADLGPAAQDAAAARLRTAEALDQALQTHAAEQVREKATLESILAEFGAGAVMTDGQGRVIFYNASAAGLLPGLALDRPLDRHLSGAALQAARARLDAGAPATDLSWMTGQGTRMSARLRRIEQGLLLTMRQPLPDSPAPARRSRRCAVMPQRWCRCSRRWKAPFPHPWRRCFGLKAEVWPQRPAGCPRSWPMTPHRVWRGWTS
ncbi:hypothetical protein ACFSYD_04230 [Paracoccus aerius]